jgi:hypothetical protein
MVFELPGRRRRGVCRRVRRSWCDAGLAGFSLFFFSCTVGSWILWRSGGSIYVYVPRFGFTIRRVIPKKGCTPTLGMHALFGTRYFYRVFFLKINTTYIYSNK